MPNRILRGIGYLAGALVALVLLLLGVLYAVSSARLSKRYEIAMAPVAIPSDSATIARGEHLATARLGCTVCHGANLAGGPVVESGMFGHFIAPNLTRGEGGIGREYTDADWVRAL